MLQSKKRLYIIMIFVGILLFGLLIGIYMHRSNGSELYSESNSSAENGTAGDNNPTEYRIESTEEEGEWIVVKTTYGSFKYPFAFSDVIDVEAVDLETSAQLRFFMKMDDSDVLLYTIHYNSDEGSLCGNLKLPDADENISVSVVFEDAPEGLSDDWQKTFYASQEIFNDILFSMAEDKNFNIVE